MDAQTCSKKATRKKVKTPCKICAQAVTTKTGLQCKGACKKWAHFICLNFSPCKIDDILSGRLEVTCPCPNCYQEKDKSKSALSKQKPGVNIPQKDLKQSDASVSEVYKKNLTSADRNKGKKKSKPIPTLGCCDSKNNDDKNKAPRLSVTELDNSNLASVTKSCCCVAKQERDPPKDAKVSPMAANVLKNALCPARSCSDPILPTKDNEKVLIGTVMQLCNTVGQLSNQIKDLMNQMLSSLDAKKS